MMSIFQVRLTNYLTLALDPSLLCPFSGSLTTLLTGTTSTSLRGCLASAVESNGGKNLLSFTVELRLATEESWGM
jgi:hypothetical protein